MNEQTTQSLPVQQTHSHKAFYTTITLSLGAAALLLVVVLGMMTKHPVSVQPEKQTLQYPSQEQALTQSVQAQLQQVTPVPVTSKQNLDTVSQVLDAADTNQITAGINQNSQDTALFSQ